MATEFSRFQTNESPNREYYQKFHSDRFGKDVKVNRYNMMCKDTNYTMGDFYDSNNSKNNINDCLSLYEIIGKRIFNKKNIIFHVFFLVTLS